MNQDIFKQIKLLELNTRRKVNTLFAGEYHSAFKGQGMTFSEFREYYHGDDVRNISWPLMARTNKPYVKIFDEEREHKLMLAIDVSGSCEFGSRNNSKAQTILSIVALLAFSAEKNNDPVGLLLFSDCVEHFVPPKKGKSHVYRILKHLYDYTGASRRTGLSTAFHYLNGVMKKGSSVFVLSDFLDSQFSQALRHLGRRHDTVALRIQDPFEQKLPSMGLLEFEDAETGELLCVDTSSLLFQKNHASVLQQQSQQAQSELQAAAVPVVEIDTQKDFYPPLLNFFKGRHK